MILSNTAFNDSTTMFAEFPQAIRESMIKSTVRLDAGVLKASGVIFNVKNNVVEILTAAHNILVYQKLRLPPNDWTQLAKAFATVLTVFPATSVAAAASSSVAVAGNKDAESAWVIDLSARQIRTLHDPGSTNPRTPHVSYLQAVAMTPDGKQLILGGQGVVGFDASNGINCGDLVTIATAW